MTKIRNYTGGNHSKSEIYNGNAAKSITMDTFIWFTKNVFCCRHTVSNISILVKKRLHVINVRRHRHVRGGTHRRKMDDIEHLEFSFLVSTHVPIQFLSLLANPSKIAIKFSLNLYLGLYLGLVHINTALDTFGMRYYRLSLFDL